MNKKLLTKYKMSLLTGLSVIALGVSPALAQDNDEKIRKLEAQLQKAMSLIEEQSEEMGKLKQKLDSVKSARSERSSGPVTSRNVAGRLERVEESLSYVEETVFQLDDRTNGRTVANTFDASKLNIGGFINTAFTYVDGEGGSAKAFNRQNFEILMRADLDDQWSAFFAGGFLREGNIVFTDTQRRKNPDFGIDNKNPEIIAWMNYKHNDQFNLRLGRIITPHGIVNIEHFPSVLLDQEQPQFLRPFSGDTIFPNFTTGLEAHGDFFYGNDTLNYRAYVSTAQDDPEELLYGGRLAYTLGDYGLTFGVNGLIGTRNEDNPVGEDSDYEMIGADILYDKGPILWKTELYSTSEDAGDDRFAFYTQPAWRFNDKWIAFYRYDYLDDGLNVGKEPGSTSVPGKLNVAGDKETIEHMVGLNFLPKPTVRLRLTGTRREFEEGGGFDEAEADIFQFSATYSF